MDSVNRNIDLLNADSCEIYGTSTCGRLPYRDALHEYYEMLDLQDDLMNTKERFQSYYQWTRIFHGVLGDEVREQLPACTKDDIKQRFPYKVGKFALDSAQLISHMLLQIG